MIRSLEPTDPTEPARPAPERPGEAAAQPSDPAPPAPLPPAVPEAAPLPTLPPPAPGSPSLPALPPPRPPALSFFLVVLGVYATLGALAQATSPALGLAWCQLATLLLPAWIAADGSNLRAPAALGLRAPPPRALAAGAALGLAGFLLAAGIMAVANALLPPRWLEAFDVTRVFQGGPLHQAALAAVAALLAPVCEEIAFRGWLLSALRARRSDGAAIALSAVLFAVMHLDPVRFPALLALGALFAWMAVRAGSVWPSAAAHAVNNVLGVVLALRAPRPSSGAELHAMAHAGLGQAAVALAVAAPLLLLGASLYRAATPAPPGAALAARDPSRPVRFDLTRVGPAAWRWAVAATVALAGIAFVR